MRSFFGQKNSPSPANAQDFEKNLRRKKVGFSEAPTRAAKFTARRSTHYSILPSLNNEAKIAYIKNMPKKNSS